jgi:hypothetical protein
MGNEESNRMQKLSQYLRIAVTAAAAVHTKKNVSSKFHNMFEFSLLRLRCHIEN